MSVGSMYYFVPFVCFPRASALIIPSRVGIRSIAGNRIEPLTSFSSRTHQNNLLLSSSNALFFSTSNDSEQEKISTQRRARDMEPLATWALDWGVILADGLQLTESSVGDWTLSLTEPFKQGSPLLTVPSHVILSSDIQDDAYLPYYDDNEMRNVYTWMAIEMGDEQPTFQQNYLPEFMLIFKIMREVYLGKNSRWYSWWQSLPQTFSTGLYLDDVERKFVECMAGEFLYTQELQHKAFLGLMRRLLAAQENRTIIPEGFYAWLRESQQLIDGKGQNLFESLVRWAFTVVFTRSWRSPDRQHAQIVPLGDLANHNSQMANLQPLFRPVDGAFQFYLTKDAVDVSELAPSDLYLSYGLSHNPGRYLVLFGFCDISAPYVDARIDFLEDEVDNSIASSSSDLGTEWPMGYLDQSRLVISTSSGSLSEEVWIAFLYKVLRENDPEELARVRAAFDGVYSFGITTTDGDGMVDKLLERWESTLATEMRAHYQNIMETDFAPIVVTEQDLLDHPNLSMIVNYNLFMRECFIGVLRYLNTFLDPADTMQNMSTSSISASFSSQYSANSSSTTQPSKSTTSISKDKTDSTMDSYAQAFNSSSMKLAGNAGALTSTTANGNNGPLPKDSSLTFYEEAGKEPTLATFSPSTAAASQSTDTSMDAYIKAINKSNGSS